MAWGLWVATGALSQEVTFAQDLNEEKQCAHVDLATECSAQEKRCEGSGV